MKRTNPWFFLLFPVAIPAMIALDYFGYRIVALIVLVVLVLSFLYTAHSAFVKFRSLRGEFASLARTLFDPGSWSIHHSPYHHTLTGIIAGHPVHYSLLGHDEKAMCQFVLEHPVGTDFIFVAGEDTEHSTRVLPDVFRAIRQRPGFCSLRALSRKAPLFSRILSGLVGSGGPGLILRKQVENPFAPAELKRDFELVLQLAESLGGEPRRDRKGN